MKKHAVALLTALCVAAGCTASADTAKHERVYVVVNHDGEVQTLLDNVHLENSDALDVLLDRTMLKDIENVSGHETFTLDGETLTWQADGSSIIYQGTSDKRPDILPHVSFTLNGCEYCYEASKEEVFSEAADETPKLTGVDAVWKKADVQYRLRTNSCIASETLLQLAQQLSQTE